MKDRIDILRSNLTRSHQNYRAWSSRPGAFTTTDREGMKRAESSIRLMEEELDRLERHAPPENRVHITARDLLRGVKR